MENTNENLAEPVASSGPALVGEGVKYDDASQTAQTAEHAESGAAKGGEKVEAAAPVCFLRRSSTFYGDDHPNSTSVECS
jgi:hypothetical protein